VSFVVQSFATLRLIANSPASRRRKSLNHKEPAPSDRSEGTQRALSHYAPDIAVAIGWQLF
jgi:hypothetical protein